MKISRDIIDYNISTPTKKGDFFLSDDGYLFMIVQDDRDKQYRLLRLADGDKETRSNNIENTIVRQGYNTIYELLNDKDTERYTVIPAEKFILSLI